MSGSTKQAFQVVEDTPTDAMGAAGARLLGIALHQLARRTLTAISDLFTLILVGLTGALAYHVLDNPTKLQIIVVFGFAAFCLMIDIIRRRSGR